MKKILIGGLVSSLFLFAGVAHAATISPSDLGSNNWFFYNDETDVIDNTLGTFVLGPGISPLGNGSVQISVTGSQRRNLATYQFAGTPLANITDLKFSTYNPSAGNAGSSNRSGYLQFNVTFDGADTWQKRLVYVPSHNGSVTQNSWKEWDAINGGNAMWEYSGTTWPLTDVGPDAGLTEAGTILRSWNDIKQDYPNAGIRATDAFFGIRVGEPYADGYTENIDKITFNGETFDFEPAGVITTSEGETYLDLQAAIDGTNDGGVITVPAGTYNSFSVSGKSGITINGAGKDSTIIAPSSLISTGVMHKYTSNVQSSVFVDNSTDVLINGMTIKSNDATPGSGGADAIVFWNASSGSIKNCAITGTYTINGVQSGQGIAVDASSDQNTDLTVDNCDISGFQKNAIDAINGNGATSGATGAITVAVNNSRLTGAGPTTAIAQNGLVTWNRGGGTVSASINGSTISGFSYTTDPQSTGVLAYGGGEITSIRNSLFSGNDINVSTTEGSPAVDAINNWWGITASTSIMALLDGDVAFDPWYLTSALTTLSSEAVSPDQDGNASLTSGMSEVIVTDAVQPVSVAVSSDVSNPTISVSSLPSFMGGSATLPQITIDSTSVDVVIPASTVVTSADTGWNGVINAPTVVSAPTITAPAGQTATAALAIEVGAGDTPLTFSKAVRLTLAGQTGKLAGWSQAGAFHAISNTCSADDQAAMDAELTDSAADCKMDVDADLVIWTKHFTTFVTYTQATTPVSSGGEGIGGSRRDVSSLLAQNTGVNPNAGQVLGAFTAADNEAAIAEIKQQLAVLISQLIGMLQQQILVLQTQNLAGAAASGY